MMIQNELQKLLQKRAQIHPEDSYNMDNAVQKKPNFLAEISMLPFHF